MAYLFSPVLSKLKKKRLYNKYKEKYKALPV